MSEYLEFRNISTIITSILLTVFGLLLGYLSSKNIIMYLETQVCNDFFYTRRDNAILNRKQNVLIIKKKVYKLNCIKIKNIFCDKVTVMRTTIQATDKKKYEKHISHK